MSLTDVCGDMHPLVGEVQHSSVGAEGRAEADIRPQHRLGEKVTGFQSSAEVVSVSNLPP